jgi:hypothetical protein
VTPEDQASLYAAVLRRTSEDPAWLGHWLARHRRTEGIGPEELAARLGLPMDRLALLCLCRTPRADHFAEDLRVVCARAGAGEEAVAGILRQEQSLARWAGAASASGQGWLMAASERPVEGQGEGQEEGRGE